MEARRSALLRALRREVGGFLHGGLVCVVFHTEKARGKWGGGTNLFDLHWQCTKRPLGWFVWCFIRKKKMESGAMIPQKYLDQVIWRELLLLQGAPTAQIITSPLTVR